MKWESRFGNSKRLIPVQTESEKRKHRCAFTGHRPEKLTRSELEIKQRLKEMVQSAIADGYNVFITGMARGVDLWAAEIVLEMKQINRDVKLICAIPYEGFEKRWSQEWIKLYRYVLKKADYVHVVSPAYSRDVFQRRNVWMVNSGQLQTPVLTSLSRPNAHILGQSL